MNVIQKMHYAQYHFLIEKRDFGEQSSTAAKATITGLLGVNLLTILHIINLDALFSRLSYWQLAIYIALPLYFIVNFFSLEQHQLENKDNEIYRAQGKLYLDIITYAPLVYAFYLVIK